MCTGGGGADMLLQAEDMLQRARGVGRDKIDAMLAVIGKEASSQVGGLANGVPAGLLAQG